ncbi:MAG: imidazoleglycerol-phosphate dehydratase HisB [Myxococcota bacterium]|nr:imidazoleglycerol-phosphate dehydratase HisB [Myxococcota bacterium]
MTPTDARIASISRTTSETEVAVTVNIDGSGRAKVSTGLGFLDHMFTALARHSGFDIDLLCTGDTHIDCHHSAEDCAMVLGRAIDAALGDRVGIERFADATVPMDEALARAAVDLSGRPWPAIDLQLRREMLGDIACENLVHVLTTLAIELRASVHVDVLKGRNDHHKVEAAFKALAIALRRAVAQTRAGDVPSTKGVL